MFSENTDKQLLFQFNGSKNTIVSSSKRVINQSEEDQIKQESGQIPVDVVEWAQQFVDSLKISPSKKTIVMERFVSFFGFLIGATSAYVMYPLAENFGSKVCNWINLTNEGGKEAIQVFFGVTSLAPMMSLGAINVQDSFEASIKHFTRPKPSDKKIIKKEHVVKTFSRGLFFIAAPFSAIPQSTLTWNNISPSNFLRPIVTSTAVVGPTFFNGRAGQMVIDKIGKNSELTHILQSRLLASVKTISKMSTDEFGIFIEKFFSPESKVSEEGLKLLFNSFGPNKIIKKQQESIGRKACSWIGFTLGALASVIYYELTVNGDKDPLNIEATWFQIFSGVISYTLNASLSAIFTQSRFEGIYDWFSGNQEEIQMTWPRMRKTFFGLSIFFGIFSSVPLGNLQIDEAMDGSIIQKMLILPAFLGPFCIRSKALELLLNRALDALIKASSNSNPSELEKVRELVVKLGMELYQKLPSLTNKIQEQILNSVEVRDNTILDKLPDSVILEEKNLNSLHEKVETNECNNNVEDPLLPKNNNRRRFCNIF